MTINIMNEYIELTKKQINEYMKLVLGERFNQNYCNLFTERYINIRYFNYYENEFYETIRRKILEHLKIVGEEIIINNIDDRELIETMRVFFYYVLYFDNVVYYKDLQQKIGQIGKIRKRVLNIEEYGFEENLYQKMQEIMNEKDELVQKFSSDKFFIKLANYPDKLKVYRVNLKFTNIKFPLEYSDFAINKAFKMGLVNEDKLIVEYYLIVLQILKDIIKLNFKKKYVLEFAETLLKKPKKIKGILNILDNPAIQDKTSLKVRYEYFLKEQEIIFGLMRQGYKITVILDNSFEPSFKNIESLQMFEFVIINRNLQHYEEIMNNKESLNNIIEI